MTLCHFQYDFDTQDIEVYISYTESGQACLLPVKVKRCDYPGKL